MRFGGSAAFRHFLPKVMEGLSKMERQDCCGAFLQIIRPSFVAESTEGLSNIDFSEFATGSQPQPPAASRSQRQPAAATGSDVNPAAQSHPSSRAGGQDYVSSKQTPSNYQGYSGILGILPRILVTITRDTLGYWAFYDVF